jgi:hypothetical protein
VTAQPSTNSANGAAKKRHSFANGRSGAGPTFDRVNVVLSCTAALFRRVPMEDANSTASIVAVEVAQSATVSVRRAIPSTVSGKAATRNRTIDFVPSPD